VSLDIVTGRFKVSEFISWARMVLCYGVKLVGAVYMAKFG
jgi:hypothetical protein